MVSGVTLLVTMVDKSGGMALFADFLSRLATPGTATAVAAFFMISVVVILAESIREWTEVLGGRKPAVSTEVPFDGAVAMGD